VRIWLGRKRSNKRRFHTETMSKETAGKNAEKVTLRVIGVIALIVGLWAASQPGNSILMLGILIGLFMLIAPSMFMR
jgi:uncharacterized membrane protein HdeD (DUF308 family)